MEKMLRYSFLGIFILAITASSIIGASGISVDNDGMIKYEEMKEGKYKYIVYKISDDYNSITVDKTGDSSASFGDLADNLKQVNACRYGTVVFNYEKDGIQRERFILLVWIPDWAHVKQKMACSSAVEVMRKALSVQNVVQASDVSELDVNYIYDTLRI